MGRIDHVPADLLSALADGELDLSAARKAQEHVRGCERCAAELASFTRLDLTLATPAPIPCAGALDLRSALLDGEVSDGEASVAVAHLSACETCRADQAVWASTQQVLRSLPVTAPSAEIDRRVARLTAPRERPRLAPPSIGGLALRGAVAAALVLAIVAGLMPSGPGSPEEAQQAPLGPQAIVAGVQQSVLYAATNTLYVLQTADAAVDAVDASTYALRARISVGGRPSALAINEAASRVLVLDATQRSLVEIDAERNAVVASTELPVSGTPTTVHVDQESGRIVLTAIADPLTGAGPAPTPTIGTSPGAGIVVVLDGTTKKLETVTSVEVAPRVVVADPSGKRSLLVSSGASTLVDGAYKALRTLPGGVAAAFSPRGDVIAVLGAEGPGTAVLTFNGDGAPGPLRLSGVPLAVTSVPEVGFAVLLGSGSGNGRILVVDEAGRAVGVSEVDQVGRDLAYDASSRKFTVVGGGKVVSAALPAGILPVQAASAPKSASPAPSSSRPNVIPPATPSPLASAAASASAAPAASASPAASPSPVALIPAVPQTAQLLGGSLYHLRADARVATVVAPGARSVWFVDQDNKLDRLDTASGEILTLDRFAKDSEIVVLAAGSRALYAVDAANSRLYTFSFDDERLQFRYLPFVARPQTMAVAPDGRIWFGLIGTGQILIYDPEKKTSETLASDLLTLRKLAFDDRGAAWFTDGGRKVSTYDVATRRLTTFLMPVTGNIQQLLPDASGQVWVGSSTGEISAIQGGSSRLVLNVRRPVTDLALDPIGSAWFLSPGAPGLGGFMYGPVDGSQLETVPGPATSLAFSTAGRAWLADPAGGFFLQLEAR